MSKDVQLYMDSVLEAGTPAQIGRSVDDIWHRMHSAMANSDISEIYTWMLQMPGENQ